MATILVVDDHEVIREMVIDLLCDAGHTVVQAANGKQAQQKIEEANPPIGLVVTDISMPEMNGIQLTLWTKKKHPEIPVILMSSDNHSCSVVADAFILKPGGFDTFLATCDQLLNRKRRK